MLEYRVEAAYEGRVKYRVQRFSIVWQPSISIEEAETPAVAIVRYHIRREAGVGLLDREGFACAYLSEQLLAEALSVYSYV